MRHRIIVKVSAESFPGLDIEDCSISFTLSPSLGGAYIYDEVESFLKRLGISMDSVEIRVN